MRFDEHFVVGALSNVSILYNAFPRDPGFSVDSRTLRPGDIFIALPGSKNNGHDFVTQALHKGAAGCVIAVDKKNVINDISKDILKDKLIIAVPNPLQALIQLATAWREQFTYPVVGITGSVGKTSTKEMIANILILNDMPIVASYDNQNTNIGASLNVLRMRNAHKAAIFELGVSKRGEMAQLAAIVKPTTALITNIGHQHMDGLGSLYDIALEKRNIFKYFAEENIGIINGDQSILSHVSYSHPVIRFGSKTTNQIQARKIRINESRINFVLKIYKKKYNITIDQPHMGCVFNALAATAAAHLLGVPENIIVKGIQLPLIVAGRFEQRPLKVAQGALINDSYNASPESMKASLLAFQHVETNAQKIAVLGDMLGLGVNSPFWHRQLGRFLRKVPSLKHVVLVGDLVKWTKKTIPVGMKVDIVSTWKEAVDTLNNTLDKESLIFVKGSSGIGLSNLVEAMSKDTSVT